MGQCTSRKATGSLTTSATFVSHIKPTKMNKSKNVKGNNDEERRTNQVSPNETSQLLGTRKPQSKCSKGVAMSFGFKRRPTPMTTGGGSALRDLENSGTSTNDPNGNRDETSGLPTRNQTTNKDRNVHKTASSQKQNSITPRPSRFGYHQSGTDRTNKVADIKTAPSPIEFGYTNKNKLTSPTTEFDMSNEKRTRTFTRNVGKIDTIEKRKLSIDNNENNASKALPSPTSLEGPLQNSIKSRLVSPTTEYESASNDKRARTRNISKTEIIGKRRIITDSNDNSASNRIGAVPIQMEKYTFQTTRLPQPEPIRVIETKTAKTIANNNKRSARLRRQLEETSIKTDTLTEDSGFGSGVSGNITENDNMTNIRFADASFTDSYRQPTLRSSTILSIMDVSDSFSETSTPPPLPELPCVFSSNSPKSTNLEKEYSCQNKRDNSTRTFMKLGTQRTFLKSRMVESDSSPHSSSENEWINAGEAMAEDTGILVSPKHEIFDNKEAIKNCCVSTSVVEAVLQTLVKPSISLEFTQNLNATQKMSLLDEDPSFTAVAANSIPGHLLDEEILSPVESLLSCSETEEIMKKKMVRSSSDSKDVNEKLTPTSPDTPSNGTYSLSLSDDKEDFLIDDEIADQPELVFEDRTRNNEDNIISLHFQQEKDSRNVKQDFMRKSRAKSYELEASPLPLRKRRDFLRSMTGSFDSLSPCESIASDDLMMEYDISQPNDVDSCDRRSGSFSSVEDTSKIGFKTDQLSFLNKNLFKSSSSKPLILSRSGTPNYIKDSPRSIKNKHATQSSPEKRNSLYQLGYSTMAYDPASDCLTLTKSNHSVIQQDIIGIKTMLLTLKRVLNESATQTSLDNDPQIYPYENNTVLNNNNNECKIELADLRRQVIFLQGQLEDKEKIVNNLQKQIDHLANQNTNFIIEAPLLLPSDIQNRCNAATQTDRVRPISSGSLTLSGSSMDDSGSMFRLLVK